MEPIFDKYPVSSIGDIAIFQPNPDIIWVGTGEANNRQDSTIGDGVYKSTDGGKTFVNMGLKDTQSIGRIVLDPKDPNIAYVAAADIYLVQTRNAVFTKQLTAARRGRIQSSLTSIQALLML